MNTTSFNNEDLKLVPVGTRCMKCLKIIDWGILKGGFNVGNAFICKECYIENKNGNYFFVG